MNEERLVVQYGLEMTEERIPALVKEETYTTRTDMFLSPSSIDAFFRNELHLDKQFEEHVYLMTFNVKGSVQAIFEVSQGTVSAAPCSLQSVAIRLLLSGGSSFVVVHNHPSGDLSPSLEDERLSERLDELAEVLGIRLLDFLIIGNTYFSFCEHNMLRNGSRG